MYSHLVVSMKGVAAKAESSAGIGVASRDATCGCCRKETGWPSGAYLGGVLQMCKWEDESWANRLVDALVEGDVGAWY